MSTAAAAGVSVAFGAPLGGVLFSLEECSTMFPARTMILAFFASSIAAITLWYLNPTGTGKLTLFTTSYHEPPAWPEYVFFLVIAIMGGMIGALFIHWNIKKTYLCRKGGKFRAMCPEILEVVIIALITGLTSYYNEYTRGLSSGTIHALFHSCRDESGGGPDMLSLCDGHGQPRHDLALARDLLLAGLIRYVQMTFTFGTGVPCGLFVPCLYTGACLGRVVGCAVKNLVSIPFLNFVDPSNVNPGVYAMIGAASVLGGTCRVTISLVVIMFELTDGLQLTVAFMLVCLVAKWVGDLFNEGIYDCLIKLRQYPFLHEPDENSFGVTAQDVMDTELEVIEILPGTVGDLLKIIDSTKYSGFPLVRSKADRTLLGYIHTAEISRELKRNQLVKDSQLVAFQQYLTTPQKGALDLSKLVDETPMRVVESTQIVQIHDMFRKLGLKLILVERYAELVGIITKKSFVHHLHEMHENAAHGEPLTVDQGADFHGAWEADAGGDLVESGHTKKDGAEKKSEGLSEPLLNSGPRVCP